MENTSAVEPLQGRTLYLIATPIGNLEDISYRAVRILGQLDALACEDTRLTRRIFERYGIPSPRIVFSYHEHNEDRAGRRILDLLEQGCSVGLCTDGGFPGISDPGYRITAAAYEAGCSVEILPGPSAVPAALAISGLPSSSYTFKGFPPRKSGARQRFLSAERDLPHTLILFESPFRISQLLDDALAVLGNRMGAVCVELTKRFQRVHRGYLEDLAAQFRGQAVKGEITVVIAGCNPKFAKDADCDNTENGDF